MTEHRRYTATEKAQAVGLAVMTSQENASEKLAIPRRTIGYWMEHPDFAELRQKTREDVADQIWATIQVAIEQVAQGLVNPKAPLRDKATALGILYDKHALLTGGATGRTESRDLTDLPDSAYVEAIREAKRLVESTSPDRATEGEPAG